LEFEGILIGIFMEYLSQFYYVYVWYQPTKYGGFHVMKNASSKTVCKSTVLMPQNMGSWKGLLESPNQQKNGLVNLKYVN
jgi:hypothetical protein